ncbi:isoleucine--tRNA ligase [Cellulomonas denverensis]|uniref:Isoleucine--tRNA ligase n=1 Tax=Cellulomonas denverensis TaxID=264297 RepID=A0A7X6QZ72_9CELL|nr:isoleucine--tRNA ligase [Cellulomonas denverensis]NKY22781.1 isoleucine--tRNA ligase [Cellulomonas denverensis]GIG26245.1 isoleucine--tRNA ligase [Cellulomonas denverensis]
MAYPMHRDEPTDAAALPASPDLPALEQQVLDYWQQDGTFQASIDQRPAGENGANEFVFYDGPPFANGLPHYGHLLTGYAKDIVGRYQTQRGRRVERRFGWDTHGLPAELEAERILGITDKSQIEEMGIKAFNEACRSSVLRYTREWEEYVTRQARWVDFEHDYKTLDPTYMESVIWAFKQLYDKGLAYQGYRVLPYCWHDQTPLSNHELKMDDDVYQDRQDQTLTVSFPFIGEAAEAAGLAGVSALAWTTTPWTLPTNQALAVGPDVTYAVLPAGPNGTTAGDGPFLLAADLLAGYAKDLGYDDVEAARAAVTRELPGRELAGLRYRRLFDYLADRDDQANAWQVLLGDFVTTEDGTGVVHLAPAYGEVDSEACEAAGIPTVLSVDDGGRFLPFVTDVAGEQVFDANRPISQRLKAEGRVLRQASYVHSYPHCWRCRNPLIYKAVSSWFVRVTQFRDRMVELNEQITWVPEHIKEGQFGNWLAGARDWSISRNRFWGTPIPVWVSDDPAYPRVDVYGSFAELEADFGRLPVNDDGEPDLHRPFIDELTRPNPDDPTGRATMRRIEDIFDVWFDSGSMPYAQVHYPFENTDWFEHHYPGDFIVEYIGQTRGWFYLLHVLATALFDKPAFLTSVSHGIVLGSDGRKMSKSLRNYPDVTEVFDRDGSDAMRWFLMASPILRGGNLVVTEEGIRSEVRQVLLPLWSTWYFFALYANAAKTPVAARRVTPDDQLSTMDRYLLARTRTLVEQVTAQLDAYDVPGACETVRQHLDLLTNWYVRTQRDRFWAEDPVAFHTLWTALETLTRVMAPLAPLLTEEVWRGLTGGRSVHLTDWPVLGDGGADDLALAPADDLVAAVDAVREAVSAALGLRKAHGLRVRQPLHELRVAVADPAALAPFTDLLAGELNVKAVRLTTIEEAGLDVRQNLAVNARAAGPRLGRGVQAAIKAAKSGAWSVDADGQVVVSTDDGPVPLLPTEYELSTTIDMAGGEGLAAGVLPGGGFVLLDLRLDDALLAEGYARDVVRAVQDARKAAGLDVSDRIALTLGVPEQDRAAVETHRDFIARETLSTSVSVGTAGELTVTVAKVGA